MTLQQIYELAVKMGMESDPRGLKEVKNQLQKTIEKHKKLSDKDKKYFDLENLQNPYSDSRILYGSPKKEIKKVLAGIDAQASEVLLTDRLNQKGEKIDALISHHPSGHALAGMHEVIDIQVDMFAKAGVPENVAHSLFDTRKAMVQRRFKPLNHSQTVDAAKLLDIPLLALHTVWDNLGNKFLQDYIGDQKYDSVGDLLDHINEIPEFIEAIKGKAAPSVVVGSKNRRTGRIIVGFTGGTNPSKELYIQLAKAGVGTLVEMHIPEEVIADLNKLHINVIDAGHMAADSIGANLYLDELERKGIEVVPCSGLIRVKRK
ncbi:MAG: Nif3-like dinuclear metal center hexameric protein [Patescibacteria group bacterium]